MQSAVVAAALTIILFRSHTYAAAAAVTGLRAHIVRMQSLTSLNVYGRWPRGTEKSLLRIIIIDVVVLS